MIKIRFTQLSFVLLLAACQAQSPVSDDIQRAISESGTPPATDNQPKTPVAPPQAVSDALLPPLPNRPASSMPRESRFDISVKDADARDFFMGLVQGSPYNMLVQPEVGGKITLDLKNVTVPEVMEAVRSVYGYDYKVRNGIYEVLPGGLSTRFFPINYLNLAREGISRTRVNSGQITKNKDSDAGSGSGSSGNSNGNGSGSGIMQIPSTEIETKSESKFWEELSQSVRAIVGDGQGRQIIASPQTGMVVVRASSQELSRVEEFLERTQLSLQRQVILEAKILEVKLSDGFQSGISWDKLGSLHGNFLKFSTKGAAPDKFNEANPLGGVLRGDYSSSDFSAAIELLKTQGTVQVLSSPRVAAVNNQKAVIKVGSDEFFVTEVSSNNTTSAAGTNSTPTVTLSPFFSGIALDVTPQISESKDITLHVHPSVTKVTDQTKELTVFSSTFSLPLAFSTSRESDTVVRAQNGQVVIIGGLMQGDSQDNEAGAPGLSKVPLLGYLFKQKRNSTNKSELVILLRPVVVDDNTWSEQVKSTETRFKDMSYPLDTTFKP